MISILLPARERPLNLQLLRKSNVEILIRVDLDDSLLDYYISLMGEDIKVYSGERWPVHKYYNFLAAQANGDWLMLWKDSLTMESADWKNKVEAFDPERPMLLWLSGVPVVSRKWYSLLNHISLGGPWVEPVSRQAGVKVSVPVKISNGYDSEELRQIKQKDAKKLRDWYAQRHIMPLD